MADEKIIVQLASPERKYVKVYHDFLDNSFLSVEEQMIFIALKSFIDFKDDSGEVFPSMETICKRAKMSEKRARKNINALIKKGIAKKVQRGLTKTNLYTLSDYATMWACDNVADVAAVADNKGVKPLTVTEHIAELEKMGYTVQIKEKGLVSEPTKAHTQAPLNNNIDIDKDSTKGAKCQAERYTMADVKTLFDYSVLIADHPEHEADLQVVFDILHEVLNSSKPTIRVSGESKPQAAVAGKLMKLTNYDIEYAIDKFHQQTGEIKNTRAYLLTILYHAREQSYLDLMNLGHRNGDF
ncbi:MAG: helix-turn-helix domain-containing protein [Lachnospiraceae bacterium]|nr:helix-turn-helix domain-containing protein [Lachnospiraceae bacterium]